MKRIVVVMDTKQGIAKNSRMPWYLPSDFKHFKKITTTGSRKLLMTGKTFRAMRRSLPGRENIIWTRDKSLGGENVKTITDLDKFLKETPDVWIIGGSALFDKTLDLADELYITRIEHDFGCDRFFPEFEDKFKLKDTSKDISENNLTFRFEKWVRK